MFCTFGNNPVCYRDPDGREFAIAFGWLPAIDGPIPFGDIIYYIGITIELIGLYHGANNYSVPGAILEIHDSNNKATENKNGNLEGKDKANKGQTAAPPGEYPGNNPQKTPKGYEWKGKPGSQQGDKTGSYYNPKTGEVLRPDLDHPEGIPPHWDYKAPDGSHWRWFPGKE